MSARILVVEDDPNLLRGLVDTLESEGYAVTAANDGQAALEVYEPGAFDLLLIDVMMPRLSGYDVCRRVRGAGDAIPVIMLTAKGEEVDKVVGLELGADDYVTKPFSVRELLARIAAVLRRATLRSAPVNDAPDLLRFGRAAIERRKYRGTLDGTSFELTRREMHLVEVFAARPGDVLSRDDLLDAVWGIKYFGTTRTLDQHIAQLRKKIEPDPAKPSIITTVHGVGYRYEGET